MKTTLVIAAIATLPAFAATGSSAPSYYQPPVLAGPSENADRPRTDGNRMPPSYQAPKPDQTPSESFPDDRSMPRQDGNRTPGMFRGGRS